MNDEQLDMIISKTFITFWVPLQTVVQMDDIFQERKHVIFNTVKFPYNALLFNIIFLLNELFLLPTKPFIVWKIDFIV